MHMGMTKERMIDCHNRKIEELSAANHRQYQIIQKMKFDHEQAILDLRSVNKELVEGLESAINAHIYDGAWKNKVRAIISKAKSQS